jgi:lipid-A-disaccharide synthase
MVVGYKLNPLTAVIARRLVKVPHISIVNLLAEKRIIPELVQEDCTPEKLSHELVRLLADPAAAQAQRDGFAGVFGLLRPPGGVPSEAAAAAVLRAIDGA